MVKYLVNVLGLNLRSKPVVKPGNKIAVLEQFHEVTKIAEYQSDANWWEVSTELQNQTISGFVAHRFLTRSDLVKFPPKKKGIRAVHLEENKVSIKRNRAGGRAYPLGEPGRPNRPTNSQEKTGDLRQIVSFLAVEKSKRYKRTSSATYCNIYAYDYCYLAGVYIPRVWWMRGALAKLEGGESLRAKYGETVSELNANSLTNWFEEYGTTFGWRRSFDLTECQRAANNGQVVIICAQRRNLNRSGHIVAIAPESGTNKAKWNNGMVINPLQSQAGATNFRYKANRKWWNEDQFKKFGFWIHA